jgi:hypothetical protein
MRKLFTVCLLLALQGCAGFNIYSVIPSFWDDNQSARIIDVRQMVDSIDCAQPVLAQAQAVSRELGWFELYSESKGKSQQDVLALTAPMQASVNDLIKRAQAGPVNKTYCEIKRKILQEQARAAASAVLGRF